MVKRQQAPRGRQGRIDTDEDAFVAGVLTFGQWAKANQGLVIGVAVLLAVVVAGGIYLRNFQSQKLQTAALELESIQASIAAGNPDAAKADLSLFLEQFAGTPYAGEAALVLGELYLDSEQPELALRSLNEAGIAPSDPLGPQSLRLEAKAHEASGDYATAEARYMQVAELTEMSFERNASWADAARMRELQGDWAGAATLYGQILAGLEDNDPSRGIYEMRREEARTHAG